MSLSQPARPGAPVTQVSKALATSTPVVANDGVRPFADAGVSPLSGAHSLHARILLSLLEDRDLVVRYSFCNTVCKEILLDWCYLGYCTDI